VTNPHKNYSPDWCTPPEWWEWAEETLDGIDLDPCADPAYPGPVEQSLTARGRSRPWRGRVYCNPPGSNSVKSIKPWWKHAMKQLESGRTTDLVWCFFNMETVFSLEPSPLSLEGWLLLPSRRVAFHRDGGRPVNPNTGRFTSPRNRTWFWSTCDPASPPISSWVVRTPCSVLDASMK